MFMPRICELPDRRCSGGIRWLGPIADTAAAWKHQARPLVARVESLLNCAPMSIRAPTLLPGEVAPERLQREDARRACNALDALIRACRADRRNGERLAPRIVDALKRLPGKLEIRPRTVLYEGARVLGESGSEAQGAADRWTLAAYMAGLRTVAASPSLNEEQLLDFITRLGALAVTAPALEAFRDFLWAEGAIGLQLELAPSFVEVASALEIAGRTTGAVGAVRAFAAFSGEGVVLKPQELDAAAADESFDVPVEPLRSAWKNRSLEPSAGDLSALRASVEPPSGWALAELELGLTVSTTRTLLTPKRAARRLLTWLDVPPGANELDRVAALLASSDEYAAAVAEAASTEELGALLARATPLAEPIVRARLSALLAHGLAPAPQRGLLRALVSAEVAESFELLTEAVRAGLAGALIDSLSCSIAEGGAHPEEQAASDEHWTRVRDVLVAAPSEQEASRAWVRVAPLALLPAALAPLRVVPLANDADAWLKALSPERLSAVVQVVVREGGVPAPLLRLLGVTHGAAFETKALYAVLAACLQSEPGIQAIAALARDRKGSDEARIAALEVAATCERLAATLLSMRFGNIFDSDPVRATRKALREQRSKRSGDS